MNANDLWQLRLAETGGCWREVHHSEPPPNRSFPVAPSHPLLTGRHWERISDRIRIYLASSTVRWSSISLLHRRPVFARIHEDDTTAVVTVEERTTAEQEKKLVEIVRDICRDQGHTTLQVECVRGEVQRFVLSPLAPHEKVPSIGCSLGVKEHKSSGTLGGYVKLCKDGQIVVCGLTCHHVLMPSQAPASSEDTSGWGQTDSSERKSSTIESFQI